MSTLPQHLQHVAALTAADLLGAKTDVGDVEVSTMYLPVGMRAGKWETQIFGETSEWDGWRIWSDTREAAQATHNTVVQALTDGRDPETAVSR